MRVPNADHLDRDWWVHGLAADFRLLDVWRFPVESPPEVPFSLFLEFLTSREGNLAGGSAAARGLFALRQWLGRVFGWDADETRAATSGEPDDSIRRALHRIDPAALAAAREGGGQLLSFESVYVGERESLAEIRNATVHALLHLGRIDGDDGWSPQMAVYVRPRGWLGRAYMAVIGPFRHAIVYPAMMRHTAATWPDFLAARWSGAPDTPPLD